ncbi:MAG TPA: TIGR03986 family CRISPR-associated RAMP protein [Candidatus Syntrophosphaera sp.]|nr:TIGR03986 family CRISPR-associated RAMP protein [Candidatus Syntrophosphaera sp.]HRS74759.1 TIGR03986 family CRISPR-associated RAMP protein [Anaerolineaceae bacterium]
MNPKHHNPKQKRRDRDGHEFWAHAPYNFVPLPEKVVAVDLAQMPGHDVYTGYTGYIDCALETRSPLYTRCALEPEFFARWADNIRKMMSDDRKMMSDDEARRKYAQFFHLDDAERPVIPGSSLRGMVRVLVEIAGYGKMQWVTERRLFFRTVDSSVIGKHYRSRMTGKVETGFLRKRGREYYIKKCDSARIRRGLLGGVEELYAGEPPNRTPRWKGQPAQYCPVWVKLSNNRRFVEHIQYQSASDCSEGRLVITGDVPGKKKEFVFLMPQVDAEEIPVSDEIIRRFHDEDQITLWQERAFPKDAPLPSRSNGYLPEDRFLQREGVPIFFLRENGALTFLGRAQMFRLPYTQSPLDLVPPDLRQPNDIDLAEAIFGWVPEAEREHGRAGRVYFTEAACEAGQKDIWLSDVAITPRVLASPKPTTFQHYLVQDKDKGHDPNNKQQLAHYATPDNETTIRGHKLYWHRREVKLDDVRERNGVDWSTDTQHTAIRPVKAGVTFRFRIYFENLRDFELGALLWVLTLPGEPDKDYCHSLGMGKPLGMGAVKITPTLYLSDRAERYTRLFAGSDWQLEEKPPDTQSFICAFENFVLNGMDAKERGQARSLNEVERIKMLLKMLEWPGPDRSLTEYMVIEPTNEYKERPVLPDPLYIEEGDNTIKDIKDSFRTS